MGAFVDRKLGWAFLSWMLALQTLHSGSGEGILFIFFRGAVRPLMTHECHSNDPLCEATLACPRAQGSHFSGGGTGQEGGESSGKDHF